MSNFFISKLLLVVANLCNLRCSANKFVCTVLTTNSIYMKIDIHVRFMKMHVLSNQFFLNTIGNCKIKATCNFFANIFVRTVLTDLFHTSCQ